MKSVFGFILLSASLGFAAPTEYKVGPGAEATFEAVGKPAMLKIKGHGAVVRGDLQLNAEASRGKFEIDLEQFDTGIEMRNKHMKEKYLETARFPTALLEVTKVDLPKDFTPGKELADVNFSGTLTLKGVPKPVSGKLKISGAKLKTEAEFSFSLKDYPIELPHYLGITLADRVIINATLPELVRK